MTKLKLLSAALVATTLVATPALARENHAAVRHHTTATTVDDARATAVDGAGCIRAPAVGAFASQPWDGAPPCEPTTVY